MLLTVTDILKSVLHRSLENFGDKFSIKHVPNVVQNGKSALRAFVSNRLAYTNGQQMRKLFSSQPVISIDWTDQVYKKQADQAHSSTQSRIDWLPHRIEPDSSV